MNETLAAFRLVFLSMVLLLCGTLVCGQTRKSSGKGPKNSAVPTLSAEDSTDTPSQVRLKLTDGPSVPVDDAWESEQGIWYRQSGVTHLVPRDRVKAIERNSDTKSKVVPQIGRLTQVTPAQTTSLEQPVWIYLTGGARVEADSAIESTAGVWYRHGTLSVFVERSRIDHIEREDVESGAESESSSKKERGWSTGNARIDNLIRQNGAKYGVDPYLVFCVMEQESHFNSHALSPKGARGLMQLMPGTSARFGVRRPSDPAQNISGGTRYLKQLLAQFNGRVDLVLASYNAGEGAVIRFGHKVPPYRETRDYVKRISYRYRRVKSPSGGSSGNTVSAGEM